MKTLKLFPALLLFSSICFSAAAQTGAEALVKDWERAKSYTKEYLDAMPADSYTLRPTPEMRSFANQMLHLTDANFAFASTAAGSKSPVDGSLEKLTDKSKENVIKEVMAGYDFVINSIGQITPAQLKESVKLFNRFDLTKEEVLAKAFEHQTHHRGQTTTYLRLAKVTPPQEKLF